MSSYIEKLNLTVENVVASLRQHNWWHEKIMVEVWLFYCAVRRLGHTVEV
jgi:hypothetical protein